MKNRWREGERDVEWRGRVEISSLQVDIQSFCADDNLF